MKAFEKNIRKVEPYVPGEQPQRKVIKLNTNENPYAPAPGVTKALEEMDTDRLRLYPDPTAAPLVNALADFYHVNPDQVFVGVGSDDVLSMCFLTFFNSEKPVFFPDITYSFYKVWADLYRIPYECQKLDENFKIVKEDYYKENGGVIFPNPNAPTGLYEDLADVEDIIAHNQDVIVRQSGNHFRRIFIQFERFCRHKATILHRRADSPPVRPGKNALFRGDSLSRRLRRRRTARR